MLILRSPSATLTRWNGQSKYGSNPDVPRSLHGTKTRWGTKEGTVGVRRKGKSVQRRGRETGKSYWRKVFYTSITRLNELPDRRESPSSRRTDVDQPIEPSSVEKTERINLWVSLKRWGFRLRWKGSSAPSSLLFSFFWYKHYVSKKPPYGSSSQREKVLRSVLSTRPSSLHPSRLFFDSLSNPTRSPH